MSFLMRSACSILGRPAGLASRLVWSTQLHPVIAAAGSPRHPWLLRSGGAVTSEHAVSLQDVVGERMPEHHRGDLGLAAHVQADEVPVAPSGVDALADRSTLILCLSFVTLHPASPGEHAGSIVGSRLERIAAILGLGRRTIDRDAFIVGPFDVVGCRKPAIGEMADRQAIEALADLLQHRLHEATVRANGGRLDPDHDRRARDGDDLHVPGRAEAAVSHLDGPYLRVGRRSARFLLLLGLLAVRLHASLTLRFHLAQGLDRGFHTLDTLPRRAFPRSTDALIAGGRVVVDLALELLHHLVRASQMFLQRLTAAERSRPRAGAN